MNINFSRELYANHIRNDFLFQYDDPKTARNSVTVYMSCVMLADIQTK